LPGKPLYDFASYIVLIDMLPLAAIERIVRNAGVSRISAEAIKEMTKTVEDLGADLALEAAQVAKHAKRRTLLREDIRLIAGKS
jgi:DNA-binding protein